MSFLFAVSLLVIMNGVLFFLGRRRGDGSHLLGIKTGLSMLVRLLPLLFCAFLLAGLLQVTLPPEVIQSWLGDEAGWRGIVVGVLAGSLILGGPYAVFPVIAGVYQAGAGLGTAVAMISGWALLGVAQIIMGISFIGLRFSLLRLLIVASFPFLAGAAVQLLGLA